jgi:hypothetical protein
MAVIQLGAIERWRRKFAIQKNEGRVVFEFSVRGPLHADEFGGENREPRLAHHDHGPGIGYRIANFALRRLVGGVGNSACLRGARSGLLTG